MNGTTELQAKSALVDIANAEAKIIIYAGFTTEFKTVFKVAKELKLTGQGYAWIASDGVTTSQISITTNEYSGVLSVFPAERYDSPITTEFENLYRYYRTAGSPDIENPTLNKTQEYRSNIRQYVYFTASCIDLIVYGLDKFLNSNSSRSITGLIAGQFL